MPWIYMFGQEKQVVQLLKFSQQFTCETGKTNNAMLRLVSWSSSHSCKVQQPHTTALSSQQKPRPPALEQKQKSIK